MTAANADGTVELTFWTEARCVCIEIVDHGVWRTPADEPTGRGRGIDIMRRLMEFVLIHHDRRGTRVFLSYPRSDIRAGRLSPPQRRCRSSPEQSELSEL